MLKEPSKCHATAKCRQDSIPIRLSFPAIYFVLPVDSSRCNNRVFIFQFPINGEINRQTVPELPVSLQWRQLPKQKTWKFVARDPNEDQFCLGAESPLVLVRPPPWSRRRRTTDHRTREETCVVGVGTVHHYGTIKFLPPINSLFPVDSPRMWCACVRVDLCIISCRFGCDHWRILVSSWVDYSPKPENLTSVKTNKNLLKNHQSFEFSGDWLHRWWWCSFTY